MKQEREWLAQNLWAPVIIDYFYYCLISWQNMSASLLCIAVSMTVAC